MELQLALDLVNIQEGIELVKQVEEYRYRRNRYTGSY